MTTTPPDACIYDHVRTPRGKGKKEKHFKVSAFGVFSRVSNINQ